MPALNIRLASSVLARIAHETFALYHADDTESGWIRAQQLSAVLRLTPHLMAANAFNAVVVAATVHGHADATLALWAAALAVVIGSALGAYAHSRGRSPAAASRRAFHSATRHAAILGALWAAVPLIWLPDLGPHGQLLIACLTGGMMSVGAFALSPLPAATLAYVGMLVAGSLGALWRTGGASLLLIDLLLLVYAATCIYGARAFGRKSIALLRSERGAERQRRMVTMLLHDFQEHASEALWETDARGRLTHASPRLSELLQIAEADALGHPLHRLLEHQSPGIGDVLAAAVAERRAFRNVVIRVRRDTGEQFWQISGKPVLDEEELVFAWRGVLVDATAEIAAEQQLRHLAHFDSLTGLANRVTLHDALRDHLASGAPGALLSMDLDHFKAINDTFGHSTGDRVLTAVADRLRRLVRPGDIVARLGGDEFAVLVRTLSGPAPVTSLAERLLSSFASPCEVHGRRHQVGLSVGVALLPEHGRAVDEILGNADLALYEAKRTGRGRVGLYSALLGEMSRRRAAVEQALKHAADRNELTLHWQPQVDVTGWRMVGAEALLRWRHPALGDVGPDEFITVAEQTGMMTKIGTWALREACRTAARSLTGLDVAVNISAVQLQEPDFVDVVRDALADADLAPGRLEIELTESIFLGDADAALARLRAIQRLGVRIALDDFGTGFSSLAYLRRFPFDTLKIDRTFVRELSVQDDAQAIVGTIVQLAQAMRMRTVAEGVESADQLSQVTRLGCRQIQGFLIARPILATELAALRAQWPTSPMLAQPPGAILH